MRDPRTTGEVHYAVDFELPGMLHAAVLRSPHASARILSVDTAGVPAEVVLLTGADLAGLGGYGCQLRDQTVVAVDRVRHIGDPVVAVAARTRAEAEEALLGIDVVYEPLPAVYDPVEAAAPGAPLVHERHAISDNDAAYFGLRPVHGSNVCHVFRVRSGAGEDGFAEADVIVEDTWRIAGAQHAAMEPHVAVAAWEGDRLRVWTGTQTPFNDRSDLAGVFGLAEEDVRVHALTMGGSFGAKTFIRVQALAAALARKAGAPVRIVLDRADEWVTLNRHPAVIRVRLGARRDGTLVAKRAVSWIDTGAYADCGPGVAQKIGYTVVGPYRIPHVSVDSLCVYTNLPPNGAFRGYGATQAVWASERTMDRLAARLGLDPLELRLRNLLRDGDVFATGETMHDVHFDECLRAAAAAVDWDGGVLGKGLCVLLKGMQTPSRASIALERIDPDRVLVRCATTEMGQGSRGAIRRLVADELDMAVEQIVLPDPDTDLVPYDTRTTSSRSTHMMSRAIEAAARALAEDGRIGIGEIANVGGLDPDTGQGIASSHWHQGAAAAEVLVDEETGTLEIVRLHVATYAGRVVDRQAAELQNEGSIVMGLGTTLFEAVDFDDGQVTNPNFSDYPIPSVADLPPFTHALLELEGAEVHGLGETAVPPVAAAVGNALASLGIELTELPLSAERVLDAVDRRDAVRGA